MRTAIAALLLCAFISGCERTTRGVGSNEVLTTGDESNYTVETIAARLEVPWAIAFTPDGLILITERPGRVRVIEKNVLRREPIAVIKGVEHAGESGLMDLILHPEYSQNRFVYISCVYEDAGSLRLRIARYRHQGTGFHFDRVIIDKIPAARFHSGCRMGFGPDGKLYIAINTGAAAI